MTDLDTALEIVALIKAGKPVSCGKGPADPYLVALADDRQEWVEATRDANARFKKAEDKVKSQAEQIAAAREALKRTVFSVKEARERLAQAFKTGNKKLHERGLSILTMAETPTELVSSPSPVHDARQAVIEASGRLVSWGLSLNLRPGSNTPEYIEQLLLRIEAVNDAHDALALAQKTEGETK